MQTNELLFHPVFESDFVTANSLDLEQDAMFSAKNITDGSECVRTEKYGLMSHLKYVHISSSGYEK